MRISGALILAVLIAMAVVVYLQSRDIEAKREAVTVIADLMREEGVEAARFDRDRALELIVVLEGLTADSDAIPLHVEDLKTIAATAARWAAGASAPSPELTASVAIRTAAGELRSHAVSPSERTLSSAGDELRRARHALTTSASSPGVASPSGMVTEGVRDRVNNLEAAQKERALELDEELGP